MPLTTQLVPTIYTPHFGVLLLELLLLRSRRPESRNRAAALFVAQKPQTQAPGI
jgi:hypothetical protein